MSFDQQLQELGPGKQLAALPIDQMIGNLGVGIAKAQAALDENAIRTTLKLGETFLNLPDPADRSALMSRSLLSLGFMPTFYQFTEASLEFKLEMKWQVEQTESLGVDASVSAAVGPVAVGASVSYDQGKKFGVDSSLMTHIRVNMVSVPPPAGFVKYVEASLKASG